MIEAVKIITKTLSSTSATTLELSMNVSSINISFREISRFS